LHARTRVHCSRARVHVCGLHANRAQCQPPRACSVHAALESCRIAPVSTELCLFSSRCRLFDGHVLTECDAHHHQGGAIALQAVFRYPRRLAGAVCLSGWVTCREVPPHPPPPGGEQSGLFRWLCWHFILPFASVCRHSLQEMTAGVAACLQASLLRICPSQGSIAHCVWFTNIIVVEGDFVDGWGVHTVQGESRMTSSTGGSNRTRLYSTLVLPYPPFCDCATPNVFW